MSLEDAIRFAVRVGEDEKLRNSLAGKSAGEVLAMAKERGYEFTLEEFEEVGEYAQSRADGELDVEELEKVVGGVNWATILQGARTGPIAPIIDIGKREGWW